MEYIDQNELTLVMPTSSKSISVLTDSGVIEPPFAKMSLSHLPRIRQFTVRIAHTILIVLHDTCNCLCDIAIDVAEKKVAVLRIEKTARHNPRAINLVYLGMKEIGMCTTVVSEEFLRALCGVADDDRLIVTIVIDADAPRKLVQPLHRLTRFKDRIGDSRGAHKDVFKHSRETRRESEFFNSLESVLQREVAHRVAQQVDRLPAKRIGAVPNFRIEPVKKIAQSEKAPADRVP